MAKRKPRPRAGGEWTEAQFWGFVRSSLRRASRRWAPIARQCHEQVKRAYEGTNKRQKWEYQCAMCGDWFPRKETQVDHIVPCGSCKTADDLPGFVSRLFCETDGLRVVCKPCHDDRHQKT